MKSLYAQGKFSEAVEVALYFSCQLGLPTDKYRVTEVKVKSLFAQDKVNESIDVALDFRRQLGLPTLKRKRVSMFIILREYIRVMRLLKKMSVEDIINLPELEDERYEMGQRMNELLGPSIYVVERNTETGLNPTSLWMEGRSFPISKVNTSTE